MKDNVVLEVSHLKKYFDLGHGRTLHAVDDVSFSIREGETLGLVGESGCGKTTLLNIIGGLDRYDSGDLIINGVSTKKYTDRDWDSYRNHTIGFVFQSYNLIPHQTVLSNVELALTISGISGAERRSRAAKALEQVGLGDQLHKHPSEMSGGQMQRVAIARALVNNPDILLADEPTTALDVTIQAQILALLKRLNQEMGMSILFISHKLNEIMEVSDRVSVLRKGKYIGTVNTSETTKQELSNMMVGRPVQLEVTKDEAKPAGEVLKVDHLCVHSHVQKRNAVNDVSFTVRAGEIVCIAGIDGNGQTELVYGLTGLDKPSSGTITLCGKDISHASIRHRGEHMSHIPEDRHKHGLVLDFTLEQNMVLQRFNEPRFENHGFINNKAVRDYANYLIDKFDVRSGQGAITRARSMSGGNQQKAIIAREVDRDKDLIVAVQPTRGLDVGAIEFIHSQLVAERDRGKAILLVSLELDEVMSLSDRILVMYEGEIVGELDPKKTTVEELGLYMAGAKRMAKEEAAV